MFKIKKVQIFILSLFNITICIGQTSSLRRTMCYSLTEIKDSAPKQIASFRVTKRSLSDIKLWGGNDYKIESADNSLSKKQIKNEIFALISSDSIFINCHKLKLQNEFALATLKDSLLIFKAGIPQEGKETHDIMRKAFIAGPIAGGIAGAQAALIRYLYILNINTEKLELLSEKYVIQLLKNKPETLKLYESEKSKEESVLLKYYFLSKQ